MPDAATMTKQPCVSALLAAVAALGLSGCYAEAPEPRSATLVETVPLPVLAANTADYRGRTVRVCGRWSPDRRAASETNRQWSISQRDPKARRPHVYSVGIKSCGERRPRLDQGCITGRIAREDGSLDLPTDMLVQSHVTGSLEWWLHPQCMAETAA